MKKELSIFIDESGDFGFEKIGASRFYILTLVFHDQTKSIAGQLAKIAKEPVFHAGPLIRQEYPFEKESIEERKKIFQSIFMFTLSLPIQCQSFCYEKKEFDGSLLGLQGKMARDLHFFSKRILMSFLNMTKQSSITTMAKTRSPRFLTAALRYRGYGILSRRKSAQKNTGSFRLQISYRPSV